MYLRGVGLVTARVTAGPLKVISRQPGEGSKIDWRKADD